MARAIRSDYPGADHHAMNRGIARRTMFDNREDRRVFAEQLEAATERGEIEVHALVLMNTHYHMLVRSPKGELSSAMQRIQTEYSRWFNRTRKRDGSLVRARYRSKLVRSDAYRRALVAYIDRNPVGAGMVARAGDYPYGSARVYEGKGGFCEGWLKTSWVESVVQTTLGLLHYDPSRYVDVFGKLPSAVRRVVEARWCSTATDDPLDDLLVSLPAGVREWMERKARLADGVPPGLPIADTSSVYTAVDRCDGLADRIAGRDARQILRAGLARQVCGARIEEISEHLGVSRSTAGKLVGIHKKLVLQDNTYAAHAAAILDKTLEGWRTYGVRHLPPHLTRLAPAAAEPPPGRAGSGAAEGV